MTVTDVKYRYNKRRENSGDNKSNFLRAFYSGRLEGKQNSFFLFSSFLNKLNGGLAVVIYLLALSSASTWLSVQ